MNVSSATTVFELACRLVQASISVVPIKVDGSKQPALREWKPYQTRLPTEQELATWFKGRIYGIAAVGGSVSGGLECIDFDEPGLFEDYAAELDRFAPELLDRCVIVKTPKVGAHVWFRSKAVQASRVLAKRPPTEEELREFPKKQFYKRIETRGAGGYALLPGSNPKCHEFYLPYVYHTERGLGDLLKVQEITAEERELLFSLAISYATLAEPAPVVNEQPIPHAGKGSGGLSIGDDFERKATWEEILAPHGWKLARGEWEHGAVTRPGKVRGTSATIGVCKGKGGEPLLYVFSTDAGIDCGTYGKFRAYAKLNHGGDCKAAAIALGHRGFGNQPNPTQKQANTQREQAEQPTVKPWAIKPTSPGPGEGISAVELVNLELPLPKYAVGGLLCEGLTILGGRPKQGKSWLSLLIAWAVAGGHDLDGRQVEGGDVLFLALEDTRRRLKSRLEMLRSAAWDFPARLHIYTQWARADQGGLFHINEWLLNHAGTARLVVIDTMAKFRKPVKGNGNSYADDYEAFGDVKALVDQYGASALGVVHTRKLAAEDPFDELSGTLAISGAADGMMLLDRKRGEESGRLFVTGRDIPEQTIPLTLERTTFRWKLGPSADGIDTEGRGETRGGPSEHTQIMQCATWLKERLGTEFSWLDAQIEAEAMAKFKIANSTYRAAKKHVPGLSYMRCGFGKGSAYRIAIGVVNCLPFGEQAEQSGIPL